MKKIQFPVSFPADSVLEILDLTLSFDVISKQIFVDISSKPTNSFTYKIPFICFPWRNIVKVPEGVALRLRQLCDTDSKFKIRSKGYQQYSITRGYKPQKVSKNFFNVTKISRETA